jgi:hypothetical protein
MALHDDNYFEQEDGCYEDDPGCVFEYCPKCGRYYDDIGFDYQYCRACGWDAENDKWCKKTEPTEADYLAGEADISTGRWY